MKRIGEHVDDIASRYGITPAELVGPSRSSHIARARFALMWLLRQLGWSTVAIGKQLGRDHSTVVRALNRAPEELVRDELSEVLAVAMLGTGSQESAAREIIEINVLLQGSVDVESLSTTKGAIAAMGLNRLATLAGEAESLLRSGSEDAQIQI